MRTIYPQFVDSETLQELERRMFQKTLHTTPVCASSSVSDAHLIRTIEKSVNAECAASSNPTCLAANSPVSKYESSYDYPEWNVILGRCLSVLSTRNRTKFLVNVFQKHCETKHCYIHPMKIQNIVNWVYDTESIAWKDAGELVCLFGIMAVASQFAYFEKDTLAFEEGLDEPGQRYYNAVLPLLGYMFLSDVFECIQGLLVVGIYLLPRRHMAERAYMYLAMAAKLGLDSGFYDEQAGPRSEEIELRNRVCWTVYILERRMALQLGRDEVIFRGRIKLPLPEDNFPGLTYCGVSNVFNQRALISLRACSRGYWNWCILIGIFMTLIWRTMFNNF